ncbi:formate dehydrogenase accessory sulfurtransferase FdhD [Chitinophaga pinensis]|uniref:Sulfur carrier protein FdhD n=1 Tax=Chitinophaga pinensis (strain ATCC 43595 / DSM 2588 / LMG 13176 / NBRC 15968 / NCIMB 11800 / UQM 2034) TaxID=485918 RepID=A0A979GSP2_CHIPD|nr:formate dehydrogenase accessory sulfurtransferase FdhD [Chitinophaga pinensis]ACU61533.1 formate dehydrogenase family accessory protein FdhD [Chitinophaga pinensis DSM 2588]
MSNPAISYTRITRVQDTIVTATEDALAAEEPLEIQLIYGPAADRQQQSISVTMRTPGQDPELATGFLFTEGIIYGNEDIKAISSESEVTNTILVSLHEQVCPVLKTSQRNFVSNAGCGVCGKTDIAAIYAPVTKEKTAGSTTTWSSAMITRLPDMLRKQQQLFDDTGGIHAAALFDGASNLLLMREDIGRHNAVDKLIGAALQQQLFPMDQYLLLLSGRAGFELIQKAAMAGIKVIAAVGAPSGMAVKMAAEWDITLIGFLRQQRFNIYTGEQRIIIANE